MRDKTIVAFAALWCASLLPSAGLADEAVINLGGGYTTLMEDDWLVYYVQESFSGRDLNSDGDLEDAVSHVRNLSTGETTNLRLAAYQRLVAPGSSWLALYVDESAQGRDLNGDGDLSDRVLHSHRLGAADTVNLELAVHPVYPYALVSQDWLVALISESAQGKDLTDDGDMDDEVLHVHRFSTGHTDNTGISGGKYRMAIVSSEWLIFALSERNTVHVHNLFTGVTTNLGLSTIHGTHTERGGTSRTVDPELITGDWLVIRVPERIQGGDLNGDGDIEDFVVHLHNLRTGATTNLGATDAVFGGDWIAYNVGESFAGGDLNGDGDTADHVVHTRKLPTGETRNPTFSRSRATGS